MTNFNNRSSLDELINQTFSDKDGALTQLPEPVDVGAQDLRARKDAEARARREGLIGGAERMGELVEDPEYQYQFEDYQTKLRDWQTAQYPTEAPDGQVPMPQIEMPIEPSKMVTREALRRRHLGEAGFGAFEKTGEGYQERKLSDADYLTVATQMRESSRQPLRGTFANPESRAALGLDVYPQNKPVDQSWYEQAGVALTQGFYNMAIPIGGTVGALGTLQESIFGQSETSKAMLNWSETVAAHVELANANANVDSKTGIDYGPLPDAVWIDALRSAPQFAFDITLAVASGGTSAAAKAGASAVGKKYAGKSAAKVLAKRRAKAFAGYAGYQSFGHQFNESYQLYVKERGMTPAEASGLILMESVAAGVSTAITSRIEGGFLFMSKPQEYLARSMMFNAARNYLVGSVSESFQEVAEQILTDAAIASIAGIRGDEERLNQVGFLQEGYLYKLWRTGAAAALLGGPAAVLTRGGLSAVDDVQTGDLGSRMTASDIYEYGVEQSRMQQENLASMEARQLAIAEERSSDLAQLSDEKLMEAIFDGFVYAGSMLPASGRGQIIQAGANEGRFRVTPLIAIAELQRRGIESGSISEETIANLLAGREGETRAQRETRQESWADSLTEVQQHTHGHRIGETDWSAGPAEKAVSGVISSNPVLAKKIAQTEGPISRSAMTAFAEEAGVNVPNVSGRTRNSFRDALKRRLPEIEAEIQQRNLQAFETEEGIVARQREEDRDIAIRSGERDLIDESINEYNEENNTNLVNDVSLSTREAANLLPSVFPLAVRIKRIQDLRNRQQIGEGTLPQTEQQAQSVKEFRESLVKRVEEREAKERAIGEELRGTEQREERERAEQEAEQQEKDEQLDAELEEEIAQDQEAETFARTEEEAAKATVEFLIARYGRDQAMKMLNALMNAESGVPLEILAQLFNVPDHLMPIRTQIPPSDSEVSEAVSQWRTIFDMKRRGEGDLFGRPAEGWSAPQETEVFPDQSPERVQTGVAGFNTQLTKTLSVLGVDTDEVSTFYDDGTNSLTDRQKRISDLGKEHGITVVFYRGVPVGHRGMHVETIPGVIGINAELSESSAAVEVFFHEAVHDLEVRNPAAWNRLLRDVVRIAPAAVRQKILQYDSAYRKAHKANKNAKMSDRLIMSETPSLAAELVSEILAEQTELIPDVVASAPVEASGMARVLTGMARRMGLKKSRTGRQYSKQNEQSATNLEAKAKNKPLNKAQSNALASSVTDALSTLKQERETGIPSGTEAVMAGVTPTMTADEFYDRLSRLNEPLTQSSEIEGEDGTKFSLTTDVSYNINRQDMAGEEIIAVQAKSEDGSIVGKIYARHEIQNEQPVITIKASELDADFHRQNVGLQMYKTLIDEGLRTGARVQSDAIVSKMAARVYRSLAKRGYTVEVNPTVYMDSDRFGVGRPDDSVFAVTSGPHSEPLQETAEGAELYAALQDFEHLGKFSFALSPDIPEADFNEASVSDLVKAHKKNPRSQFLSEIDIKDLSEKVKNKTALPVISSDGNSGYVLVLNDPDNPDFGWDIQGVFNMGKVKGAGKAAIVDAIARGGRTLDAFDGYLPRLYGAFGFKETHRSAFNDEYAPVNWDYEKYGRPDVVLMTYTGAETNAEEIANAYDPTKEEPAGSNYITGEWPSSNERLEGLLQSTVLRGYEKGSTSVESSRRVQRFLGDESPRFSLTEETNKAVKELQKQNIDLPKVFAGEPLDEGRFKTVQSQMTAVMADMARAGVNTPEHFAQVVKNAFGLTDIAADQFRKALAEKSTKVVSADAVVGGNFVKHLLVKTTANISPEKGGVVGDPKTAKTPEDGHRLRKKSLANIDLLLQRHPNAFSSENNSNAFMADLFRATTVPIAPHNFIKLLQNEESHVNLLSTATEKQLNGRRHGMDLGRQMRKLYSQGKMEPKHTAMLMTWGILSRQLSPFPQESAALQAFASPEFNETVDAILSGEAQNWPTKKWLAKANKITKKFFPTAKGATGNLNAAFTYKVKPKNKPAYLNKGMLAKLADIAPSGKTYLEVAHEIFSSDATGKEMRRRLMTELPFGIGIDIKVISFLLLVSGKTDVLIMDRVQIENMYDDGRFNGINIYGPASVKGSKKKPPSGLSELYKGFKSLAIYEALEAQLEPTLEAAYEKSGIGAGEASLGAWHWDTWNIRSGQAASHGSLQYLISDAAQNLDTTAPELMSASELRYGSTAYGLQFVPATSPDSSPRLLYKIDDNAFEFTARTWQNASKKRGSVLKPSTELPRTDHKGKRFQNGNSINEDFVLDDGTNPLTDESGNRIPWYEDDKLLVADGKQKWLDIIERHGVRASLGTVDEVTAPIDAGTVGSVFKSADPRFSVVSDDTPRDIVDADSEQQSMIERLRDVQRRWTGDLPPEYEAEDDIFVGEQTKPPRGRILEKIMTPLDWVIMATKEGHPVRNAIRRIIAIAMDNEIKSRQEAIADTSAYNAMPKDWKQNKGYRFAQLMDQYVPLRNNNTELDGNTRVEYDQTAGLGDQASTRKVLVKDLPQPVQDALLHFRQRSEEQRLKIVQEKRDFLRRILGRSTFADLQQLALKEEEGRPALYTELEIDTVDGEKVFVSSDRYITREELAEELVMHQVPNDWGMQYSHFHHAFFGKFKLKAYRQDGSAIIVGDANTQGEAFEKLKNFKDGSRGAEFVRFEAMPEIRNNPDITRMSGRQRSRLAQQIKRQAEMTSSEVNNALKGVVGLKQNKKPFFAPMMQRGETPAEGFSMDFPRVWQMQTNNFNRWYFGGQMIRETQPVIEQLTGSDPYWAEYLEQHLDRTMFIRPTTVEKSMDALIQGIPFVGKMIGDMPTRRFFAASRTFNYLRQLKTPRQWLINSIQPLQTVYPVVGEKTFKEAVAVYNSSEGKTLLNKIGRMDASSGMYIDGTESSMGQRAIDVVTRGQELADKHLLRGKISTQSESRNMNFSMVAFYIHGKKQGMDENAAIEYARQKGLIESQFVYTRSNLPPILNGPIANTLLQYRRFQINMIGFGLKLLKEKNYPALGRWLLVNTVAGGLKGVMFTFLPGYFLLHGACQMVGLCDETQRRDNILYATRKKLKNLVGEEHANAMIFGLPAYLGADISGSLSLFNEPYGRTFAERVQSQFEGPTFGFIHDLYDSLTAETVTPTSTTTRVYRSLKDTGPAFKWLAKNVEYLAGYHNEYDDRGRLRYRDEDKGRAIWMQLGAGFRTVPESVWSLEFDRLQILEAVSDRAMGDAAVLWSGGQYSKAINVIKRHNASWPMMSFGISDLEARIKNARTGASVPQAERRAWEDAPKRVEKQFRMERYF